MERKHANVRVGWSSAKRWIIRVDRDALALGERQIPTDSGTRLTDRIPPL
jgi:hypothetical protein